ncbi:MAG: tetratricopeptide repeat protein [Xanthomonadaceae bacterium]|nr:tetratricopeptide repeat protein [Xanthomonadaceae bacterium]
MQQAIECPPSGYRPAAEAKVKAFILLLQVGAVLFAASFAGCAHVPTARTGDVTPLFRDTLFKPPAEPVDSRAIFAVDAPMRRFLADEIVPQTRHKDPRQALLDALNGKLLIDYDSEMTRTASQTFAAREGNCLSLVIMAAAMAEQLGIRVTYQEVYDFDTWSRDAGFAILSQHVNLVLGQRGPRDRFFTSDATPMIVDFLPPRQVADAVSRPVPEQTVVAMYLNNRAAEVMVGGDVDRAYWFARAALEADPGFANAANTLGVIYLTRNHLVPAERAMRYALQREPDNISAMSNLSGLLAKEGRTAETQILARRLAQVQRHPPFYFYDRGVKAMQAGQFAEAARLFEKSLSQRPYDAPSHFELAVAASHLGDMRRAREQLELAEQNSTTPESRAIYAAKLRHLKSLN